MYNSDENAIALNNTLKLVQLELWMHVILYKYLCLVKANSLKVSIVALSCQQMLGMEYSEKFAFVVKLTLICIFLSTFAVMDLETCQMDVVTALLNGDLDEIICLEVPDAFKYPKRHDFAWKL